MRLSTMNSRTRMFVPLLVCLGLALVMAETTAIRPGLAQEAAEADEKAPSLAQPETPGKEALVSINFKETDMREVLNILAYKGGINIVAGEDVVAKVTVQLKDVPWEQALDVILKTYNFTYKKEGNLVRVMSLVRSLEEEGKVPLVTKIISLNFADVNRLKESLSKMLSKRGTMEIDSRTNSLIITDIPEMVEKVDRAAQNLDTKTPQVLIEAMMVDVKVGETDSWGSLISSLTANKSKNNTAVLTSDLGVTGAEFEFQTLTDTLNLNAVLTFLISNNKATILANPKVLTLDNQEAKIEIIESIPYYESVDSGSGTTTNVKFKEAGTKLFVTPHITSGRYISMNVKPEQSFKSAEVLDGQPVIDSRKAETNLLVGDGQTIVIGGLRQSKNTVTRNKVPFFGDIPVIGLLFKSKSVERIDTELVLFVTPHIIYDSVMSDRELELFQQLDSTARIKVDERTELQRVKDSLRMLDKFKAKEIEDNEIAARAGGRQPAVKPKPVSKKKDKYNFTSVSTDTAREGEYSQEDELDYEAAKFRRSLSHVEDGEQ
ncbi:MAG: secretin and TonB N-terminal domain-containing protein [Candidatus Omnitrophica bacterium]|nr:secretin and TonB N-terminal domain-containing protein [Candidatus Omnitrophota bacterium]